MNNAYTITVGAPLLRPGLTISTTVSYGYLKDAVTNIMGAVRMINGSKPPQIDIPIFSHPPPPPSQRRMSEQIEKILRRNP